MTTTDPTLREQVTDVVVRYATGIDSRDWSLFRTCFTDDCDADYGEIGHWRSGDEITEWMDRTHAPVGPTMHQIANVVVRSGPEAGRASSRAYVHAVMVMPDRTSALHAYGWYDDEMVAAADGWRIARRRFTPATSEIHPAAG